ISIPFFDFGGILADDPNTEKAVLSKAIQIGRRIRAENIELRNIKPLQSISSNANKPKNSGDTDNAVSAKDEHILTRTHKVRMLLELPDSSETLMKSFKSKLRSQIRKPLKEGLTSKVGRIELLDDFYEVFAYNMRDLGSPVHSKRLMKSVLAKYPDTSRVVVVYQIDKPLACSIVVGFQDTLENPWASSLREYSKLAPNMLLYWTMLKYACERGYQYFDFGRSTPGEGTFKFKKQWGAEPVLLHWHYFQVYGNSAHRNASENETLEKAGDIWRKLPVAVTKIIGPRIRKHIGL
ncbi:MAG: GNAT family N-acetyltransferase, partial [bacterium]